MRVIFLDMDGVICTWRSHFAQGQPMPNGVLEALDREGVGLLNLLAEQGTGPVYYVSCSTWRRIYTKEWMENHLRKYGWRGQFHEDWATKSLTDGEKERGHEVEEWLSRHPVEGYVILDDGSGFSQKQRHIKPNYDNGLSWDDFRNACLLLWGMQSEFAREVA